tara:strand:- start:2943 stop:5900 length:2958 start_codon:yes stop_codon:yes gene_type:complete
MRNFKSILLGVISLVFSSQFFAQTTGCTVDLTALNDTVLCGDSIHLNADGTSYQIQLSEDFDNSTLGPGWQGTAGISFNNPCGNGPGGATNAHMWMGNGLAGNRSVATVNFDLSCGGNICFDFRMAIQGQASPCEGPDQSNEGVYLQYSTDNGVTWTTINYFDPDINNSGGSSSSPYVTWSNYCFNIPPGAQTPSTQIRWHQINTSGSAFDHWGIDNVDIYTTCATGFAYNWYGIDSAQVPVNPNFIFQDSGNFSLHDTFLYGDLTYAVMFFNSIDTCFDTLSIEVLNNPIEAALSNPQICYLQDSASVVLSGGDTYTWNILSGDPLNAGTNIGCINCDSTWLSPATTTTYQVGSNLTGICHDYDTITLESVTVLDPSFNFNDPVCNNGDTLIGVPYVSGGTWSGTGIIDSVLGIFDPNLTQAGPIPVTYTIPGICSSDTTVNVQVIPLPDAGYSGPTEFCATGGPYTLTPNTPGGVWSGPGIIDSINGIWDPAGTGLMGNYQITYTLNNPCFNEETFSLLAYGARNFNFIEDPINVCANDTLVLYNNYNLNTGGSGNPVLASWSGPSITNSDSGYYTPSITGTDTVYLTVSDTNNSCGRTKALTIEVFPVDTPNVIGELVYCDNLTSAVISIDKGWNPSNVTYSFTPIVGSGNITVDALGRFNPRAVGEGTWEVYYSYTNLNGCTASLTDTLQVIRTPEDPIITSDIFCVGEAVVLSASGSEPDTVFWYESNTPSSSSQIGSGTPYFWGVASDDDISDVKTVYARAENSECTSDLISHDITVVPAPDVSITRTYVDSLGNSETTYNPAERLSGRAPFTIDFIADGANVPPDSVYWDFWNNGSPADGSYGWPAISDAGDAPFHPYTYQTEGQYLVMLVTTNEYGCSDTSYAQHEVTFEAEPPNVFTPNGDGVNDEFYIPGATALRDFNCIIYSRWGREVYQWSNPYEGWDGGDSNDGVYYYIVTGKRADGSDYTRRGTVTLTKGN